jgi:hypothetical protein
LVQLGPHDFFPVSDDTKNVSYRASEPTTRQSIGDLLIQDPNLLVALHQASVFDIAELLQHASLRTKEDATKEAERYVAQDGTLLQSAEEKAQAITQGVQNVIRGGHRKAARFVQWLASGLQYGYVGGRTKAHIVECLDRVFPPNDSPTAVSLEKKIKTAVAEGTDPSSTTLATVLLPTGQYLSTKWAKHHYHVESNTAITEHEHTLGLLSVALVVTVMAIVAFWRFRSSITMQTFDFAHASTSETAVESIE